jgi:hypothetical protein
MRFSNWRADRPFLALLIVTLAGAACAPVQPWERGRLAQPQMALDQDPLLSAMNEHVYTAKEAAAGGAGPAGGGCGCN